MPKGPSGQKRPADAIGAAVMVGRIATGEISDDIKKSHGRSKSGKAGGLARAASLSEAERVAQSVSAASRRWNNERRRAMEKTNCNLLAQLFADKVKQEGLVDVKFYLKNLEEAAAEQVCGEVLGMYAAINRGEYAVLDFKDGRD